MRKKSGKVRRGNVRRKVSGRGNTKFSGIAEETLRTNEYTLQ